MGLGALDKVGSNGWKTNLKEEDRLMATTGYITLEQLKSLYSKGEIDTVIMAFTDMQGRLIGKRVAARHFLDNIADHGAECCNYLLAVDIENNTIQGYEISSWDTGYADMAMIPDMKTMRMAPWLPGSHGAIRIVFISGIIAMSA